MSQGSNFVDYVKISCRSGKGGAGSAYLHRDKKTSMGGPAGGDGARGGHVIIKGNAQLWTLLHLKFSKHVMAGDGGAGGATMKSGKMGRDEIVEVPLGTIAKDVETGEILFEITKDAEERVLLNGGKGGLGNANFKSPTNQTPRYAQPGLPGKEEWKILELKVLADVGLVGFPNAGKSTLLSVITAAKPEIGDYPFTTIVPNLGIVSYRGHQSFIMADIPGIIEGASEGKGLGFRFLRHIERNAVLLFMVPADTSRTIKEEYEILLKELTVFNPELMQKPKIIAISKTDLLDEELLKEMKAQLPQNIPSIFISSLANQGLMELKDLLWKTINA